VGSGITSIFDLLLALAVVSPWVGMVLISLVTAVVALVVFRYTSNQRGIKKAKDAILANLLEVLLFRDDLKLVLRAQSRLAVQNLRYFGFALLPLLVMMIPMSILLVQVDLRYGHRALAVGEQAIVAVQTRPGTKLDAISLTAPAGIAVETKSLRIPRTGEVDWRIRAKAAGKYQLHVRTEGQDYTKDLVVGGRTGAIATERLATSAIGQILHPGESPLSQAGALQEIRISYPSASLVCYGHEIHWIWAWLVLSMLIGMIIKGPMKVQI
jgi:hypothetical protein